ncbi:Concanavalin A-like lectin/glucanases superfamily protein [bacterium A37T11]|nr:Concanavalin A-like lectin/glucanases superfamily protein [bacterium A37T11]
MKRNMFNIFVVGILFAFMISGLNSCQKMDRPALHIIPDDTARINGPLQLYLPFENTITDSAQYQKGIPGGTISYAEGVRGKAYQGATNAQINFPLTPVLANAGSFTVSFWINTQKHDGGAQCIFMLPNTGDFWGNLFATIEGNTNANDNSMLLKFNFAGNWVEFSGNNGVDRLPDMYGKWRHLAFRYDEKNSKFAAFLNGEPISLPNSVTDRMKDGAPLGKLTFSNPARFVIGAYQQHIGTSGAAETWMLRYTGMLDQFRVYAKALSDTDIKSFYLNKE